MAIKCTCLEKFRDKRGNIKGYRLQDFNGNKLDITPDNLKTCLFTKQLDIDNLKMTSDGRIIDKTMNKNSTIVASNNKENEVTIEIDKDQEQLNHNAMIELIETFYKECIKHKDFQDTTIERYNQIKIKHCLDRVLGDNIKCKDFIGLNEKVVGPFLVKFNTKYLIEFSEITKPIVLNRIAYYGYDTNLVQDKKKLIVDNLVTITNIIKEEIEKANINMIDILETVYDILKNYNKYSIKIKSRFIYNQVDFDLRLEKKVKDTRLDISVFKLIVDYDWKNNLYKFKYYNLHKLGKTIKNGGYTIETYDYERLWNMNKLGDTLENVKTLLIADIEKHVSNSEKQLEDELGKLRAQGKLDYEY